MAFKNIADIKPHDNAEPIQIRVIRKWKPYQRRELCFLFIDIHGNAIEAKADLHEEAHFNAIITIQDCYIVSEYLSDNANSSMNVVPHPACIVLGTRTIFAPFDDDNIPSNYFNFASYEQLHPRSGNHFLLTDYIGRIDRVSNILSRANKNMLKIILQDQSEHFIEATLWEDIAYSFNREEAAQKSPPVIIALTSMKVSEYKGSLQLGSTNATTITINPNIAELDVVINRFEEIKGDSPTYPTFQRSIVTEESELNRSTLQDLLEKIPEENAGIRFTCLASISEIHSYGTWYYESCSECKKKLIRKGEKLACPDHGEIESPRYLYCVNATIADNTSTATVVVFNEPMTTLLGYDCNEMVVTKGYTDPNIIPTPMKQIRGKPRIFQLQIQTLKKQGNASLRVNRVFEPQTCSTSIATSANSRDTLSTKSAKRPITNQSEVGGSSVKVNKVLKPTNAYSGSLKIPKAATALNTAAEKQIRKQNPHNSEAEDKLAAKKTTRKHNL